MSTETEAERPGWLEYWKQPAHTGPLGQHPGWRKAKHPKGVVYFAPWEEVWAGFPEHARRAAVALANTGPVHLRSQTGRMQFYTARDHEAQEAYNCMYETLKPLLQASIGCYEANVWQVIASDPDFHRLGGPKHHYLEEHELRQIQAQRVIYTVFERDRISPSAAECLGRVGQVWVANQLDRAMLIAHGLEAQKVRVVPVVFAPDDPHLRIRELPRRPGPVRFYHIGKWEPRKAHHEMLLAYLLAFSPGEASFVVKTSERGPKLKSAYPQSPAESVRALLALPSVFEKGWTLQAVNRDIKIIQQRITAEELWKLHRSSDVYVTLARGEGFDMPAFDARLAGRVLVYTRSGGPQDFAFTQGKPGHCDLAVPSLGVVPCDPFYNWGDACYLDYSTDAAVLALQQARALVEDEALMKHRQVLDAEALATYLTPTFGAAAVGARMRDYLEELTGPGCRWEP